MAVPCLAVKDHEVVVAVKLSDALRRELLRAGYVEGRDFHAVVEVPHPSLADEAFRKLKSPLVEILEEILVGIEAQGLATRSELNRLRDVLERAYGQYPTQDTADRDSLVAKRRAAYRTALVDGDRLRCVTSDRYERVWDADVLGEIERWLLPNGFVPARPTINKDTRGTNILGNAKPALFRSGRDSFFLFYGDREPGDDGFGGLRRGIVVFNSEVGAKSFGFSTFYFREMCSNFLIWDATAVTTRRARHTGAVKHVVREFREDLQEVGAVLTTAELDTFDRARTTRFVPEGPNEREATVSRLVREFRLPEADALEVADLVRAPENPGEFPEPRSWRAA